LERLSLCDDQQTSKSGYKILHVTPFFPPDIGGIANHVSNLCIHLSKQGTDNISIVAPRHVRALRKDSVPTVHNSEHTTNRVNSFYLPGWPYPTLRSVSIPIDLGFGIDSLIRKGSFDIIHAHGHHYPISWIAIKSAHKYNIPCVLTLHAGMYLLNPYTLGGKTWFEQLFNKFIVSRILPRTTAVIGLTKQITDFAKEFGGLQSPTKYFTIPNGVNTSIYKKNLQKKNEYRVKYNLRPESVVILFCGRFEHVKGIIEFAKAIKNIIKNKGNEVEALIVGGGTLEYDIRSILSNIKGAHLIGWQSHDYIHELYIASDIFVNPSKSEALPITIIEAMNACLHIVYTPVGGVPDILQGYSSKTMLANASNDEIQKALLSLITDHCILSKKTIADSFAYAQKFDWNNIAHDMTQIYRELSKTSSNETVNG
jgi:glycosyltransferase involved in cell wall biosynthesis